MSRSPAEAAIAASDLSGNRRIRKDMRSRGSGSAQQLEEIYMTVKIPYGHVTLQWEGEFTSYEMLHAHESELAAGRSQEQIVAEAMEAPIGSAPLKELAKGKKNAVIVISDHTRPVPSKLLLPLMLKELREGSPEIEITLLVATGCHRGTTEEELRQKLGDAIFTKEKIRVHDCDDMDHMVNLGRLPSGTDLWVNRLAAETELLVAEGFIEPHFFAGFSGGRKSVLPGICARRTVMANHCAALIDDPCSRTGILEKNPIHADMTAAARMAQLRYVVNVILDSDKKVVRAVAGDAIEAHRAGCGFLSSICAVHPAKKGDLVITSNGGAPLDQNLYQSVKCMAAAEAAAAEGGTIIVCCECADGIGGEQFYRAVKECDSAAQLLKKIRRVKPEDTVPDQWQYQILCRILEKHRVIFVTGKELEKTVTDMKMEYAESLGEAIRLSGAGGKHVVIIPDGIAVMVV